MAVHRPHSSAPRLHDPRTGSPRRRGNSLILVTAILVLLVIVAAAFLSRTQSGRQVSSAQQQSVQRGERVEPIANMVTELVTDALFPQPLDPNAMLAGNIGTGHRVSAADSGMSTVTSSWPRLAIEPNAPLLGVDRDFNNDMVPDFAYNGASYETRAWTNWPDFLNQNFPAGPGQINGVLVGAGNIPIGDSNPLGNPGTADNRWLRSTEPVRFDANGDGLPDGFSHWEHLTWLATANNGFRLCTDISHVMNNTLDSSNEADPSKPFALGMPYEQWLANFVPAGISSATEFRTRANNWFAAPSNGSSYPFTYASSNAMPNLFRLADLPADVRAEVSRTLADTDGDGITDAFWFLAPASMDRSMRYLVAASVVDLSSLVNVNVGTRFNPWNTTGATPSDLALVGNSGTPGESVGFFDFPGNTAEGAGSIYSLYTAADANATTGVFAPALVTYNPQFFGEDDAAVGPTFLKALGMKDAAGNRNPSLLDLDFQANDRAEFYSSFERLQYWKSSALAAGAPEFGLTPFGISDELELRAFNGQNNPWTTTRLESAMNGQDKFYQFFRSTPLRGETHEKVAQLTNHGLMLDNRHKATTINGARNDVAPNWLWPSPYADPRLDYNRDRFVADVNGDLVLDAGADPVKVQADLDAFARQKKKIDLRQAFTDGLNSDPNAAAAQVFNRRYAWRNDVQQLLERSLTRVWVDGTNPTSPTLLYQSYLGRMADANPVDQYNQFRKTLHMAASMAANIDQYRDGPDPTVTIPFDAPLHPWIGTSPPDWLEPTTAIRYIGQERQPFLMEAFFALVYPKSKVGQGNNIVADLAAKGYVVNNDWEIPQPFKSSGEHFVDSSSKPGIVMAVQLGNPTDLPMSLAGFALRIDGRTYAFPPNSILPPTTRERPATVTVYAIKASNTDNAGSGDPGYFTSASWVNFLDLQTADLAPGSLVLDGSASLVNPVNMKSPVEYETSGGIQTAPFYDMDVELVRLIPWPAGIGAPPAANGTATVVIDRFDTPGDSGWNFRAAVNRLLQDDTRRPPKQAYDISDIDIDRWSMNGVRIKNDDYLVAYARVARPWTWDVPVRLPEAGSTVAQGSSDGIIRPDELNPRYVFAFKADARPKDSGDLPDLKVQDGSPQESSFQGDIYAFEDAPDGDGIDPASLWITYDYTDIYGAKERDGVTDRPLRRGKPTFFPCISRHTGQNNVYPAGATFPTLAELEPAVPPASLAINATFPKGTYDPFTIGDKGLKATDWEHIYKPVSGGPGTTNLDALMSPFQMNIKDDDFEQVGELLNVFCWGPVLDCTSSFFTPETVKTFSEIMIQEKETTDQPAGRGVYVNRLHFTPFRDAGVVANNLSGFAPTDGPTPLLASPLVSNGGSLASAFFSGVLPNQGLPSPSAQQQSYNREVSKLVGRPNMPNLPAGMGILDGVVCDDRGWRFAAADHDQEVFRPRNAAGFEERLTPGLVNLSNALTETMRALPHMTALVHNDSPVHYIDEYGNDSTLTVGSASNPLTRVVDSLQRYRDKTVSRETGGWPNTSGVITPPVVGVQNAPFYFDRGLDLTPAGINTSLLAPYVWDTMTFNGLRADRGLASIGEVLLTQRAPNAGSGGAWNVDASYSVEFAGLDPYKVGGVGAPPAGSYQALNTPRFGTDRTSGRVSAYPAPAVVTTTDNPLPRVSFVKVVPDRVGGDAEKRNLLFSGMSNMISVRSDVFAVYLRIKSVRQDPVNGRWDATDPNLLADDSRYVMIIDRSTVKKPGDRPRVLAFQKVESPN